MTDAYYTLFKANLLKPHWQKKKRSIDIWKQLYILLSLRSKKPTFTSLLPQPPSGSSLSKPLSIKSLENPNICIHMEKETRTKPICIKHIYIQKPTIFLVGTKVEEKRTSAEPRKDIYTSIY
ncbi:unnamed protein product [Cuscuta europaea]|uniref:Uncharacterized protein n=1 Tax=Cuscuta europaea TaxID=41803 RepID=A0A9P0YP21_CUSEU|nr:unnamed protein product [Cuscuta europaea]